MKKREIGVVVTDMILIPNFVKIRPYPQLLL